MARKVGNPNWGKGKSGNPGGKPIQLKGLVDRCREFVEKEGIDALISLAKDTQDRKLQLAAIIYITNRGFGAPTDKIAIESMPVINIDWANTALSNPELAADISKLMGKIAKK